MPSQNNTPSRPVSKPRIRLGLDIWWPKATAAILFERMPYMLDAFDFVHDNNPEYVIFDDVRKSGKYTRKVRIYMPGENIWPDMDCCDWAFAHKYSESIPNQDRYLRFPNYVRLGAGENLIKRNDYNAQQILVQKTKFCAFIFSNTNVEMRNKVFNLLSKYKRVDSPGVAFNNMPSFDRDPNPFSSKNYLTKYDDKVKFLRNYKFTIAFANESSAGYTSEKIYHAMLANSIPLYWGNPHIHRDFNTKSFLNLHEYESVADFVDKVVELDRNDQLYMRYLTEPWYPNNQLTQYTNPQTYVDRFRKIFRMAS